MNRTNWPYWLDSPHWPHWWGRPGWTGWRTVAKSGIDLFQVEEGRIVTVWSVTGLRRFAP